MKKIILKKCKNEKTIAKFAITALLALGIFGMSRAVSAVAKSSASSVQDYAPISKKPSPTIVNEPLGTKKVIQIAQEHYEKYDMNVWDFYDVLLKYNHIERDDVDSLPSSTAIKLPPISDALLILDKEVSSPFFFEKDKSSLEFVLNTQINSVFDRWQESSRECYNACGKFIGMAPVKVTVVTTENRISIRSQNPGTENFEFSREVSERQIPFEQFSQANQKKLEELKKAQSKLQPEH